MGRCPSLVSVTIREKPGQEIHVGKMFKGNTPKRTSESTRRKDTLVRNYHA